MTKLEERIRESLNAAADSLPETGVVTTGRSSWRPRGIVIGTAMAIVVAVVIGGTAMVWNSSIGASDVGAAPAVFDDGYALSPYEMATLMVKCLQEQGLDVTQEGNAIGFDDRVVSESDFETTSQACKARLRAAGFLLPEDNPDNLRVLYQQYEALADCYRSAGIEISDAPSVEVFIETYRSGTGSWSPQAEARETVGIETSQAAELGCHIPSAEEIWNAG